MPLAEKKTDIFRLQKIIESFTVYGLFIIILPLQILAHKKSVLLLLCREFTDVCLSSTYFS